MPTGHESGHREGFTSVGEERYLDRGEFALFAKPKSEPRVQPAAPEIWGSPPNKKATVIRHLTTCTNLLCKACRPIFAQEFPSASASVRHSKPLRRNCAL
ncbi:hypothetical protein B9Z19DRAFT_1134258 [Tuber borchii]|uniref:Uncharacterized protein n=1 Tax=Tuber borchii TaxID=42251 RepID=A0A2T6ZEE2_TUBBO|nr:hypothetical protein B9Z19DRAFT_1134258 [Tuber borchii]